MIYDVGDVVKLSTVLMDTSGVVNNTATMTLLVTKPDGSTTSPSVTNTGSGGVYTASVTVDQSSLWRYLWTASGAVVATEPGQFTVDPPRALVASMEEFKAHLNRTDLADDVELRTHLSAATECVEAEIGGPLAVQTFTETASARGSSIAPVKRPLVSVTSVTPLYPPGAAALASTSYYVDTTLDLICPYVWWPWTGPYTVVYRAGLASIPERVKLAGLIIGAHMWETQNGFAGRRNADDLVVTQMGFAIPRRADELLAPSRPAGVA